MKPSAQSKIPLKSVTIPENQLRSSW